MAIEDALRMLATDYWESVWLGLTSDQRSELTTAVRELIRTEPDDDAFFTALLAVLDVLRNMLPERHAILEAAYDSYRWAAAPPADWKPVLAGLSGQIAVITQDDVRERLRQSPTLTADQIRSAGSNPSDPSLIRLESTTGEFRFPAFQFDPAGRPVATVLTVNERLGADEDPWGAADWWLGENAWLDAVPADLLGSHDDLLLAAVDALTRPGW